MLAIAADKIKAFNTVLARPFVATAEKWWPVRHDGDTGESGRFSASFTRSRREIVRAQRLRYRVFSDAYGASFSSPFGLDRDRFDKHCLHLVVRDNQTGELVGYTRVLPQDRLAQSGGFYSAGEFDLSMLDQLDGRIAEIGRTCIHPDYRNGAVITVLWSRLAQFMVEENIDWLIGCASVALNESYPVADIVARIRERHLSDSTRRVVPRVVMEELALAVGGAESVKMPPLLKAYLRMGAEVCGEPCLDAEFNCLDFFILLSRNALPSRYLQHFLAPKAVS